ncbi:hypothetical protein COO60DRAFT_1700525 [Scenedesmus sp. NREL 46B-D3]|nr:hypothetical protein COO60DRAFT_1700525 [Scenedesmus sp. NREL 46B-D3]
MRPRAVALLLVLASSALVQAEYATIYEAAVDNELTMFLEASNRISGFTEQIKSPGFIGTVFAPTDDAIQAALDTAGVTKDQLFRNNSLLVDIVQYHVVPGDAISSERLKDDGVYTSMRGKQLTITKSLGGDVAVNSGSTARVIEKDQKAGAAMFNVINNLLLPPDELASSLEEAVGSVDELSILYAAIGDAGLSSYLGNSTTVATLFAPSDDAWYTIDTMSNYYAGNTTAIMGNKQQLANLLKYHVLPGKALRASQLRDNMTLTMLNGETVMIHVTNKTARKVTERIMREQAVISARISGVDPSMHIILKPDSDGDEGTITSADVVAGSSYLHKVDAVLVPKSTLDFLDSITADSGKQVGKNATVSEAFGKNVTANGTDANATASGDETAGEPKVLQMTIENVGSNSKHLTRVFQLRPLPEVAVLRDLPHEGWHLLAGQTLSVQVEVVPQHGGILCSLIIFEFQGFLIARELRIECDPFFGDDSIPDISASAPYMRQHRRPPRARQQPLSQGRRSRAARLRQLAVGGNAEQLQQELGQYKDRTDVTSHLSKVPGLAEARPSLLRGDALYVSEQGSSSESSRKYQGFVREVLQEEVLLRFSRRFHDQVFLPGRRFNVRFAIKRTGFVFMHEPLDVARRGLVAGARPELLLPPPDAAAVPGNGLEVQHWFDRKVASNPEQRAAVQSIVAGTCGRLPYIIWGPPGTGKTSTMVEAAAQVLKLLPSSRLLLVSPSNLAADLLAQRLLQSGRPKPRGDLLDGLLPVCWWDEGKQAFELPPLAAVVQGRVRVVVVTALMAGKLHALGVPAGHFSHIMFDEAGHAEEPLALCALAGLSGSATAVVLAGDPKQLGPVIHSRLRVGEAGLRLSLLERLAGSKPYSAAEQHPTAAAGLIVKLVRNYRSHPELLELPSRLFYGGQLQACASSDVTHTLLHWERLRCKPMPLLFHSIVGKDEREGNSPSWFNIQECKQASSAALRLLA